MRMIGKKQGCRVKDNTFTRDDGGLKVDDGYGDGEHTASKNVGRMNWSGGQGKWEWATNWIPWSKLESVLFLWVMKEFKKWWVFNIWSLRSWPSGFAPSVNPCAAFMACYMFAHALKSLQMYQAHVMIAVCLNQTTRSRVFVESVRNSLCDLLDASLKENFKTLQIVSEKYLYMAQENFFVFFSLVGSTNLPWFSSA